MDAGRWWDLTADRVECSRSRVSDHRGKQTGCDPEHEPLLLMTVVQRAAPHMLSFEHVCMHKQLLFPSHMSQ
jgi:hypothetical protein